MVRCKMRCIEVTESSSSYGGPPVESKRVKLSAVADEANKSWSKWTPGGDVSLTINNPDAFAQFKVGEFYFVDFTVAPAKEADEAK